MKIIWRVSPEATGRYRSFEMRSWPSAHYANGKESAAFCLSCESAYVPADVKMGNHKEIKIRVAIYSTTPKERAEKGAFVWGTLTRRAATLKEAKQIAAEFLALHYKVIHTEVL